MVGKVAEHDEEPILTSPVIIRKEKEVFEKTPEVNTKRKFKLKSRRGAACKTNLEDKTVFKRKLQEEEEESVTSPVFKKQKTLVLNNDDPLPKTESVLPTTSIDIITTTTNDDNVADIFEDDGWGDDLTETDMLISEHQKPQSVMKTPVKQLDEDILACLDDSPFPGSSPPPPGSSSHRPLPISAQLGRHRVIAVESVPGCLKLVLKEDHGGEIDRTAVIMGSWLNTVVNEGDIVHIEGEWDNEGVTVINDKQGLIVVNPDTLVSSTAVVSALFCMRKALLSEKFKSLEGGNRVMLIGTLVHELLQEVLREQKFKRPDILHILDRLLKAQRMVEDMCAQGISDGDMRKEVEPFIGHIQYFVRRFLHGHSGAKPEVGEEDRGRKGEQREQWKGKVAEVRDIEENFWSPRLGIKGKIDLTVETVGITGERSVKPLEIKTGKPTYSTSHMGQVMLYCMMSGDRREQAKSGLLLYLRSSGISEVPAGIHEQRGLVQLRNELVAWLKHPGSELPEPVSHEKACKSCGLLGICSTYQEVQKNIPPNPHPMAGLVKESISHLQEPDLAWFKKWTDLLDMEVEAAARKGGQEVKDLWCLTPEEREKRGQAVAGLVLEKVGEDGHLFTRETEVYNSQGLVVGEVVIVSSGTELALAQGVLKSIESNKIVIWLDRDLSKHGPVFTVDRYTYQGGLGSCYVGLARVIADTAEATRIRKVLVGREEPGFSKGLGREVAIQGREVLRELNKVQQKAVFRSLMCEHYSLIRGMPGSGKTTTIVGLVRLLARLGQSVLLVAYTNSAVDTILCKLQEKGETFLRVGRKDRVRSELISSTSEVVAKHCTTPTMLSECYISYNVVGSTCMSVDHAAITNRQFDWCVLDEASQALLPSVLSPLLKAKEFILVGDTAQLPPTVQSPEAKKEGLDMSLFTMLDNLHTSATINLYLQYRMNSKIAELANHLTYEGKLECGNDSIKDKVIKLSRGAEGWLQNIFSCEMDKSVVWVDTMRLCMEDKEVNGICNKAEARLIQTFVREFLERGVLEEDVGVIAPYSAQVKLIKAGLG